MVFGPRPRDFSKKTNRTVKRLALRKALSERLKAGDVHGASTNLKLASAKTKEFLAVLVRLATQGHGADRRPATNANLRRASRNVAQVELTTGQDLNTYQVLRSDTVWFSPAARLKPWRND